MGLAVYRLWRRDLRAILRWGGGPRLSACTEKNCVATAERNGPAAADSLPGNSSGQQLSLAGPQILHGPQGLGTQLEFKFGHVRGDARARRGFEPCGGLAGEARAHIGARSLE